MAARIVLTGASGYIGARLAERAAQRGCEVVVLGSAPPFIRLKAFRWRLCDPIPDDAIDGSTAVIHLGHSWASDDTAGASADNLNLRGSLLLASAALDSNARFVFASTTSARPQALNVYGRIKHMIEEEVARLPGSEGVRCARIGLVYGGPDRGQYGLISRLVELTPVLPMIGLNRVLQPIHLDEVCDGLLKLALDPPPERRKLVLAGNPVTFGKWLRILKRGRTGKGLVLVPVPLTVALWACDATAFIPFVTTVSRERVLGLAGAAPMDSGADVAALGLTPRDPQTALLDTRVARLRLISEAASMLTYMSKQRRRSAGMIIRLARALAKDPASRIALPRIAVTWPGLLRLFEPLRPSMQHGLSRRLHLAAMVAETEASDPHQASILSILQQVAWEIAVAPLRLLLARVCA
jgi:nucleoside-diphosphate-sugar epimerase